MESFDVVVIGGGQAGLALGYYLRRTGLSFVILDAEEGPGGAWRHGWSSLTLFSPAQWSSLPGWLMPGGVDYYPARDELLEYMGAYEARYELPIERPVWVEAVERDRSGLIVRATDGRAWRARAIVSATGSWRSPWIPDIPGRDRFAGTQIHSAQYREPSPFAGKRVLVVGGGNSGAQILADLAGTADVTWSTLKPPTLLPPHIDGRYLFEQATLRYKAKQAGEPLPPPASLGDIVQVPPVRRAHEQGLLTARGPVRRFTETAAEFDDGSTLQVDTVIWCTGFKPALEHLRPLGVIEDDGRVDVEGTRSKREPRLWLVGYGEWTGYASATLIAVGRSARATVEEVAAALTSEG